MHPTRMGGNGGLWPIALSLLRGGRGDGSASCPSTGSPVTYTGFGRSRAPHNADCRITTLSQTPDARRQTLPARRSTPFFQRPTCTPFGESWHCSVSVGRDHRPVRHLHALLRQDRHFPRGRLQSHSAAEPTIYGYRDKPADVTLRLHHGRASTTSSKKDAEQEGRLARRTSSKDEQQEGRLATRTSSKDD
ncbi:hypothetical protein PMIN01_08661 [Paraphaeosphaeria minitans]|uniref:Uncharacterized protein n=1 Tax=Paraphaeosphaeria minitans TaxID=565426 RepID=A0A9P6GF22_9PLEO|nr:hypothetical protein PMIN01_08661 [Paraphaeosphaeria minitans]